MPKAKLTFEPSNPSVGEHYSCIGSGFKPDSFVSIYAAYTIGQATNGQVGPDGSFDLSMMATGAGSVVHTVSTNPQGPGQGSAHEICQATLVVG